MPDELWNKSLTPNKDPWENSKNVDVLRSFVVYCKNNPEMRFWQALRNWAYDATECNWLGFTKQYSEVLIDTFNWRGKGPNER